MRFRSGNQQRPPHSFGIACNRFEISTRRLIRLCPALLAIPQRAERNLKPRGEFFLGQPERAAQRLGPWNRPHAGKVRLSQWLGVRVVLGGGVGLLVRHRVESAAIMFWCFLPVILWCFHRGICVAHKVRPFELR